MLLLIIYHHIIQCWVDYVLVFHCPCSFLRHVINLRLQSTRGKRVFEFDRIKKCGGEKLRAKEKAGGTLYKLSSHTGMQACSPCVTIATAPH